MFVLTVWIFWHFIYLCDCIVWNNEAYGCCFFYLPAIFQNTCWWSFQNLKNTIKKLQGCVQKVRFVCKNISTEASAELLDFWSFYNFCKVCNLSNINLHRSLNIQVSTASNRFLSLWSTSPNVWVGGCFTIC